MRDEFWLEDQSPDLFDIEDDQTPDSFGAFSNIMRGPEGPPGPPGPQGEPGADGTVSFDELTPAQRESLRGEGVPAGGTTGQVLAKSSNEDYETEWIDAGGSASMTILSYGNSTWADFVAAYNSNSIVYCRASSNTDPATGVQGRMAFMAYVNLNSSGNPTRVEFQYYRSVSSHTDAQQGDQVFVYALTNAGAWSVTVREAYTKIAAGSNMSSSYSNGTLTLSATGGGTEMTILSYGNSTWADFIAAYNSKSIVYCRASISTDPSAGSQVRMAAMSYVNHPTVPTSVDFLFYFPATHSDSQQGDQVFVYTLTNANGGTWSFAKKEASTKIVAGTNMTSSYANGTLTLNATGGGGGTSLTAGDGIDITNDVIKNTQGIEYIVGTQTAATAAWTGVSTDETLKVGKIIAYYLPYAGTSTDATLTLTMADGSTTEAIPLRRQSTGTVTTQFAASNVIILIYTGNYWRVSAYYDTTTNTVPTGYCTTSAATAAKVATCSYGYRGDTNYFPCLFRYANTAANATLAISSYATTALPIYVNGERTSSTNTFSAGVILFLFYNDAYYCYNDGRLPILVDGAVTSVQEYVDAIDATEVIVVNIASYSGSQVRVPSSGTNAAITADHVLLASTIGTPANQTGNWTVTTYDGYLTLSGSASGATTVQLVLGKAGTTI